MTKVKTILLVLVCFVVIIAIALNFNSIVDELSELFKAHPDLVINPGNDYTKEYSFEFIQQSEDYVPHSKEDLYDIFFSTLNKGWIEFTFYCPIEYTTCLEDIENLSNDKVLLSDINNFVSPFNSYSSIRTVYDDTGAITIQVVRLYSDTEIQQINAELDKMMNMADSKALLWDKILVLHDYIINNTQYDTVRADEGTSSHDSTRMTGLLFEHYSICGGYADTMAALLDRLGVTNYKISSDNHVWNAVLLDGVWYHLDLTWDDPVTNTGRNVLDHTYFLIDDNKLTQLAKDSKDHIFDKKVYLEFN
jgi:hypothetical protein